MEFKTLWVFLLAFVALPGCIVATSSWDDLKVTYSLNIFSKYGFNRIERTLSQVTNEQKWVPLLNESNCMSEIGNFQFYGNPMTENGDRSVVTLYDKNGIIAGIQAYLPHDEMISRQNIYRFDLQPMYQNVTLNGKQYFVLTAYFVDPATICTQGRDEEALSREGTGTGLWFQNGPTPDDLIEVPRKRSKAIDKGWTKNNCFHAMGYHNFYNVTHTEETNCTQSRPAFLLFNKKDQLHGFGFVAQGHATSPKFEHPPNWAVKRILGYAPACTLEQNSLVGSTSLHVYFISRPQFVWCPLWKRSV